MRVVIVTGSQRHARRHAMRGVSLVEVLVSILLSAIGLLALSGANVASIRYSKMSQYRATATLLAADLAERMRANKAGLASYAYATTNFAAQAAATLTANTTCDGYTGTCTTAAGVAAYDLANWRLLVRNQLPEGAVVISVQGTVGANVWIAWRDPAVANADAGDTTDVRGNALECPSELNVSTDTSIRCSFFRINL